MPGCIPLRRLWWTTLQFGPAVLLLSLLPSLSYVDHWSEFAAGVVSQEERAVEGDETNTSESHNEHAAHCHTSVASCSEQPAPADLRLLHVVVEVREPVLIETALDYTQTILEGFVSPIPSEPPRLAA